MESKPTLKSARKMLYFGTPAWAAALCFAFAASCALAQTEPKQTEQKPEQAKAQPDQAKPKAEEAKPEGEQLRPDAPGAEPKAPHPGVSDAKASPKPPKAKPQSGCGGGKKVSPKRRGMKTSLTPDPNTKWACDQTTVTLEALWRGKPMVFAFEIRNEGTADLKIKARGG